VEDGLDVRRTIGFLRQDPRFYTWMTGRETLQFTGRFFDLSGAAIDRRSAELLDLVDLSGAADRKMGGYSGGMRQRLGIAQALIGRPQVVLLDEPVSALDPIGRHEVLDLMSELKGETTVFYSTHILDDVQRVSDNVAILDKGRLVRAAPTAELLNTFNRDRLRVGIVGGSDETAIDLAKLPGVIAVQADERDGDLRTYSVRINAEDALRVQREVTRFASERDLTLTENGLIRLDLEDIFLRLIDSKERAA
jgi:ABC-2 type transport system ATP-binding protein